MFVEFFNTRIAKFVGWLFGFAGLVATYISGWGLLTYFIGEQNALSIWPTAYILLLTALIIVFTAFRQLQTMRKEKYANITGYLHSISHNVRDLNTYIEENVPDEGADKTQYLTFLNSARKDFSTILDQLSVTFTSITGTKCRSCIKLIYARQTETGVDKLYFYTFQRDTASRKSLIDLDNERVANDHDPQDGNPQFEAICNDGNPHKWHYFCNDLTKEKDFTSTSMTAYDKHYGRRFNFTWLNWLTGKVWPLPYKSCVSCVVRQGPTTTDQKKIADPVLGFLSVDSESRSVFEERWDKELVFMVADSLYWPLKKILAIQQVADNLPDVNSD